MTSVAPVRPAAPYIGGKRNLARRLTALIETVDHATYAEPFVGMGGVFLRRRKRPKAEVINDLNGDVANFFRVLQAHPAWLEELIAFQVTSRAEWIRQAATPAHTLTDVQRAARFLYLQRLAFGGRVYSQHFGVSVGRAAAFDTDQLRPVLSALHRRLSGVVIECLDWSAFVSRYDRAETLFYLDPPYWDCEGDYGPAMFGADQFSLMAEQLGGIRGRFILSINDRPEVREIFRRFDVRPIETAYSISGGAKPAAELIITNI